MSDVLLVFLVGLLAVLARPMNSAGARSRARALEIERQLAELEQVPTQTIAPEDVVETELAAGVTKPLVDLRLDLEIAEGDAGGLLELADLPRQLEPFADQVEDAAVQCLDVPPVLVQQRGLGS